VDGEADMIQMFLGWRNNEDTMNMEASKHTIVLNLIHGSIRLRSAT